MTSNALRRRGRPNDLRGYASGFTKPTAAVVHDRRSQDAPINSEYVEVEIDDPYGLEPGAKIGALRSIRNDPLADMRARGQIDEGDYRGGRHWQDAFENSQIGSVRAIDPTKEAVDGGRPPEMLTDRQRKGAKDVDAAREELGKVGDTLIRDVLGQGLSIRTIAGLRGVTTDRGRRILGARFRECLATLAVLYGLAMKPRK